MFSSPPTAALLAVLSTLTLAGTATAGDDCTPTWDGTIGQPGFSSGIGFDFVAHDDGSGAALYLGGNFTTIGGTSAARIAKWDGSGWSALGGGLSSNECYAVGSFGGDLYAAGYFNSADGVAGTAKLARWDGTQWHSIGAQLELFSNQLWDLTTWDDGNGDALYIAGNFMNIGGAGGASFIAKWDGTSFSSLGAPIGGAVPLIVFTSYAWDDGNGEDLYIGGRFLSVDGVPASRIARWDGTSWSALGTGVTGSGVTPSVNAMVAFDDGSGEALYVAGQSFVTAGGMSANRVARWDGSAWSAVGDGFADGIVWDLEVFDDGNGPALYAFGTFSSSGGTPLGGVAKWDGSAWVSPGGLADDDCYSGLVYDDGSGSAMYVGGRYSTIGGVSANGVARLQACGDLAGDVNGDGSVDFDDLLDVLAAWGACGGPPCPADLNGDGSVDFDDLLAVLANWS